MKKTDLQTGVVYAYKPSRYDAIAPVVLVSTDLYATNGPHYRKPEPGTPHFRPARGSETRPVKGTFGSPTVGYLAVSNQRFDYTAPSGEPLSDEALRSLTLTSVLGDHVFGSDVPEGYVARLINSVGIIGVYDEVVGAKERAEQAERAHYAEALRQAQAQVAAAMPQHDRLVMLGLALDAPSVRESRHWVGGEYVTSGEAVGTQAVVVERSELAKMADLIDYLKREAAASWEMVSEMQSGTDARNAANRAEWIKMLTINDDLS